MKAYIFLLVIGIAAGYYVGFNDAKTHKHDIVSRLVARAGGSTRHRYGNDVDGRMEQLERP
jgi:hypothetical protein